MRIASYVFAAPLLLVTRLAAADEPVSTTTTTSATAEPPTEAAARTPAPPTPDQVTADAKPNKTTGFDVGLRTGINIPTGTAIPGVSQNDFVSVQVPFQLDLGYRFTPNFYAGIYGSLAVGGAGSSAGTSAVAVSLRGGIQGQVHFMPTEKLDPWAGIGFGLESTGVGFTDRAGGRQSVALAGWDVVRLQGGADYALTPGFRIGPYGEFAASKYSNASVSGGGTTTTTLTGSLDDTSWHEWLTIGIRGSIMP